MKCDDLRLLDLLSDDPQHSLHELLSHLQHCPRCRERLHLLLLTQESLKPVGQKKPRQGLLFLAASVLLLVIYPVGHWIDQESSLAALATDEPYLLFPLRTRGSWAAETDAGLAAYLRGHYALAEQLLAVRADDDEAIFYRGVSLYLLKRYRDTIRVLQPLRQSSRWRGPALWYLAQAHLKLEQKTEAMQILQLLRRERGLGRKAARLLKKLETNP